MLRGPKNTSFEIPTEINTVLNWAHSMPFCHFKFVFLPKSIATKPGLHQ